MQKERGKVIDVECSMRNADGLLDSAVVNNERLRLLV